MTVFSTRYFYSRPRVGATCPYRTWPVTIAISTCAPAWGATYPFPQFGHCAANFYSRPRVGGDNVSMGATSEERISTHAPAWGGDPEFDSIVVELREFLLTPPYGGRHHFVIKGCVGVGISTHAPE